MYTHPVVRAICICLVALFVLSNRAEAQAHLTDDLTRLLRILRGTVPGKTVDINPRAAAEIVHRTTRRANQIRTLDDLAEAGGGIPIQSIRNARREAIVAELLFRLERVSLANEYAPTASTAVEIITTAHCSGLKSSLTTGSDASAGDYVIYLLQAGIQSVLPVPPEVKAIQIVDLASRLVRAASDLRTQTFGKEAVYRAYIQGVCGIPDHIAFYLDSSNPHQNTYVEPFNNEPNGLDVWSSVTDHRLLIIPLQI